MTEADKAEYDAEGCLHKLKALATALEALNGDCHPNAQATRDATAWLTEMLSETVEEAFKAFEALPAARAKALAEGDAS